MVSLLAGCGGPGSDPSDPGVDPSDTGASEATATFGDVTVVVHAEDGAFPPGSSIDLSESDGSVSESPSTSLIGGPIQVTERSGLQPQAPVEVVFEVDPAVLARVDVPLVIHYDEAVGVWTAEPTTVDLDAGTVVVSLDSFSWLDLVDAITYTAGSITGNRAGSGPTDCGTPPDWVDGILAYNGQNDPLRTCLSTSANGELEVHVVNNRGYPVTLTLGEGHPRIFTEPAVPGDAVSMLSVALAQRNAAATVVQSGAQVHLVYERPAPGEVVNVHVKARTDALSYWTSAMGSALSGFVANGINSSDPRVQAWNRIRKQVANAQGQTDCLLTVVSETAVPPQDAAVGAEALQTCSDQFQEVMRQEGVNGRLIGAFSKTVKALAIVDTGYKLIDRAADPVNGAGFDLDLNGARRPYTDVTEFATQSGVVCDLAEADGFPEEAAVVFCYTPDWDGDVLLVDLETGPYISQCPAAVGVGLVPHAEVAFGCLDQVPSTQVLLQPGSVVQYGGYECTVQSDTVECLLTSGSFPWMEPYGFKFGNNTLQFLDDGQWR